MKLPTLTLLVSIVALTANLPAQELISCPPDRGAGGDIIDRGFYVPDFPADSLGVVVLSVACNTPGEQTFMLVARELAYDGPILGVATASLTSSGGTYDEQSLRFDFHGTPVAEGSTVTFTLDPLLIQAGTTCYINVGSNSGELCEGRVIETEFTVPPLDVFRRNGLAITIFPGDGPVPSTSWIAVVSHANGFAGSVWRSALSLLNRGVEQASVTLRLHLGSVHERSLTLEAGHEVILEDVVSWIESGLSGSGALEVVSDQPLVVLARTANTIADGSGCFPGGSFGQIFDGRTVHSGFVTEEIVRLSSLRESEAARTNIGFANTGSAQAQVAYMLFDASGTEVYSSDTITIPQGTWLQENRPFLERAGLDDVDGGWAVVRITRGTGVQVYASLIDALTGDAATIWATH